MDTTRCACCSGFLRQSLWLGQNGPPPVCNQCQCQCSPAPALYHTVLLCFVVFCVLIAVLFLSSFVWKGKERRAFLLLALEASWPIGEAPSPKTLDIARRLFGREQLANRGKLRYVQGDGKPHQIHHPVPPSTESVWRHWDSNHRPHRSKVNGASLTTSPLVALVEMHACMQLQLMLTWIT